MNRANNIHAWEGRGFSPAVTNAGRSPHLTAVGGRGGRQAEATFWNSYHA